MSDGTIDLPDGRTLGYHEFGPADGVAVLWCHGGPGSRMEPNTVAAAMADDGIRVIGFDRPGYGLSTPRPGRSIEACVPDTLALADHLGIDAFYAVGVSTGGAYALSTAAIAPERVIGVIACCALTDMRDAECKQVMSQGAIADIWSSANRDEALAFAADQFGEDGTKMLSGADDAGIGLAEADMAMFTDPEFLAGMIASLQPMFAWGAQGYADDRLADGPGWGGFDVGAIRCPVVVLHGMADTICPVINAHHTADIVPNSELHLTERDGHFSVVAQVPGVLAEMMASA
jgi:pimeloyl-ACP methyl ester carboxylesterase